MRKFLKKIVGLIQLNLFYSVEECDLLSIEELRALRLKKQQIENKKKYKKYIMEMNKRHKNWVDKRNKNFSEKFSILK